MILTLIVLAAVTAILAAGMASQQTHFRSVVNRMERDRAQRMADAGLFRALAALEAINAGVTTFTEDWYALSGNATELFRVKSGAFRVQIVDASSLVNLNTATETQLTNLNLTTEQIDSLLDWREPGTVPRVEGAKDEYYNQLTTPYNAKLGRIDSISELLLIKGFLPSTLYNPPEQTTTSGFEPVPIAQVCGIDSYCPNVDPTGQQRANINTVNVQQMIQAGLAPQVANAIQIRRNAGTFTDIGQVLTVPGMNNTSAGIILDSFTVGTETRLEGRINLNTATEAALGTIPNLTPDIAQAIVGRQSSGMVSMGELLTIPGITLPFLQQSANLMTLNSDTFLVRIMGIAGGSKVCREAVVTSIGGVIRVLKIVDSPFDDMTSRWQWTTDTTSETDLGSAQ